MLHTLTPLDSRHCKLNTQIPVLQIYVTQTCCLN
uniref:Uncharacterized protein n=1 Tax=Arundo donax TaxID=35708 RepID=A0A0A9HIT8_ARUDO